LNDDYEKKEKRRKEVVLGFYGVLRRFFPFFLLLLVCTGIERGVVFFLSYFLGAGNELNGHEMK